MEQIKAIETVYNGYRFRSRAEARWAVFFDALGIKYVYEPEGFELSDGTMYLPDFYLCDQNAFFEVKGIMAEKDMHKIKQLIKDSKRPVAVGYADMSFQSCDWWWEGEYDLTEKDCSVLVKCTECNKYYFSGVGGYYGCQICGAYEGDHYFHVVASGDHDSYHEDMNVKNAVALAKQARFEHGETPENRRY